MKPNQLLLAVCLGFFTVGVTRGADSQPVGSLGRPEKLGIEGAQTFSQEEIREAIFNELDVLVASVPEAPLPALIKVVGDKAVVGYRAAGFPDVKVSVEAAGEKLLMRVNEGQRFTNGVIRVSGNHRADADGIISALTHAKTEGPKPRSLWPAGKPASFNKDVEERLRIHALSAIRDQGYYRAKLTATVTADRATQQAVLHVDLRDEGRLSVLGDVTITGNERNGRDAIMSYLALDAAAPLARELREQVERRLLASGRFISVHWELNEPKAVGDSWKPRLTLEEYEPAPPLGGSLSREETAVLKAAEWFQRLETSDEEIVLRDGAGDNVLVFAPKRGFIAFVKPWAADARAEGEPRFDYAIVMDEERVGLYSRPQRQKIVAEPPPSPVIAEAGLNVINGAPDWGGEDKATFGVGWSTKVSKGYRRHVKLNFELTATAALSILYKHKAKPVWDGDILSLAWADRELRVNSVTGQLIEHVVKEPAADGRAANEEARLAVMPGEFERLRREIEEATAAWPNTADARRPLSCLAEFLCRLMEEYAAYSLQHSGDVSDFLRDDDADPNQHEFIEDFRQNFAAEMKDGYTRKRDSFAALRKAISHGLLGPFDRLLSEFGRPPRDGFSIPLRTFDVRARSLAELCSLVLEVAPIFGVRVGNALFSTDTWMNAAWREGLFAVAGKNLVSLRFRPVRITERIGPLKALAAAELLKAIDGERQSTMYALRGRLQWPPDAAFRAECRELASGKGFASEVLRAAAATMCQLDANDIQALFELLVEFEALNQAQAVALEFAALRAHFAESPEAAATNALDAIWRAGLSSWVEKRLGELAELPKGPERANQSSPDACKP